jgi:hypothetical protein
VSEEMDEAERKAAYWAKKQHRLAIKQRREALEKLCTADPEEAAALAFTALSLPAHLVQGITSGSYAAARAMYGPIEPLTKRRTTTR